MSTGTDVATNERRSVIREMAHRYGMEPDTFENTVRATCMPQGRDAVPMTREEFAAGIMVAENYKLNPILREIYFYPRKGGGIVPVVSIDGWLSLINRRKELDGIEFDELHDDKGKLVSITCRIYRTDRKHPTVVTEHLSECWRDTIPWKMPHRMLRHKALIQCARYAFGFAGIHDEDEAERIVDAVATEVSGPAAPVPQASISAPPAPQPAATHATGKPGSDFDRSDPAGRDHPVQEAEIVEAPSPAEGGGVQAEPEKPAEVQHPEYAQEEPFDVEKWLEEVHGHFERAKTLSDVDDVHTTFEDTAVDLPSIERQKYEDMHGGAIKRIEDEIRKEQEVIDQSANERLDLPSDKQSPQADMSEAQDEDDDVALEDDDDQPAAPGPNAADLYVTKIRAMLADPETAFPVIGKLWNDTKVERAEMIASGLMSKETRNELLAELDQRKKGAAAPQDGPGAPPPANHGPAAPPPANDQAGEDPVMVMDREFRAQLDACSDKIAVATLAAETLVARNKFSGTPQHKAWSDLISAKRKSFAGVTA